MAEKLYRSYDKKVIGGVCAGLAEYFNIDTVIVRLIFILLTLAAGQMILVYILAWIIIPSRKPGEIESVQPDTLTPVRAGSDSKGMWFGIILVLLGVVFLLDNFFYWDWWNYSRFWPLLVIALGLIIIYRAFGKKENAKEVTHESE
jgi:phage shock protein C